jgi:tetratricopeptide (TPR) repeat protein
MDNFNMTGKPDLAKVMYMLKNMPDGGASVMSNAMSHMQERVVSAAQCQTKDGLADNFKKARRKCTQPGWPFSGQMKGHHVVNFTDSTTVKPKLTSVPALKTTQPILIKDLQLNSTHRGKALYGRVAVDHAFARMSTTVLLMEDLVGDLVEINLYNLPVATTDKVETLFAKGKGIVVIEPFFKDRSDMTVGIRIEDPAEISSWPFPETHGELKDFGNLFMTSSVPSYGSALLCYEIALHSSEPSFVAAKNDVSRLFSNIAQCEKMTKNYNRAIWYSAAATFLDPSNAKAWYRFAMCTTAMIKPLDEAALFGTVREILFHADKHIDTSGREWDAHKKIASYYTMSANERKQIALTPVPFMWASLPGIVRMSTILDSSSTCNRQRHEGTFESTLAAGRTMFSKNLYEEAKAVYQAALSSSLFSDVVRDISIIANNMAAACLKVSDMEPKALFCSTVSAIMCPTSVKSWLRASRCLSLLDSPLSGSELLQDAAENCGNILTEREARVFKACVYAEMASLSKKINQGAKTKPISSTSTEQQRVERMPFMGNLEHEEQDIDDYIKTIEKNFLVQKMAMADKTSRSKLVKIFGPLCLRIVPEIHTELPLNAGYPAGVDADFAFKLLYRAYLNSTSHPHWVSYMMKEGKFSLTFQQKVKRWHGTQGVEYIENYRGSIVPGTIVDCEVASYCKQTRANFGNNPGDPFMQLRQGSTHVAVGFSDLDLLLSSTMQSIENGSQLIFVGYERSEFSIAKTIVVLEMLSGDYDPSMIFQVWYSSTWLKEVQEMFRISCGRALKRRAKSIDRGSAEIEEKISSYLRTWMVAEPVSVAEANYLWSGNSANYTSSKFATCCSLVRQKDRVAVLQYLLNGELIPPLEDESTQANVTPQASAPQPTNRQSKKKKKKPPQRASAKHVPKGNMGSILFWCIPEGAPPLEEDNVFNTVSFECLVEELENTPDSNLVEAFISLKVRQLAKLQRLLHSKNVEIRIKHGDISPTSHLLKEIRKLKPASVSWSNLVDYFDIKDFHETASAMSTPGTIHYGYSMNWPTKVYGACISDYLHNPREMKRILDRSLRVQQDPYLVIPNFDTPLNLCGNELVSDMKHVWLKHFESNQCKVISNHVLRPFPLHRTSRTLHLQWRYNNN